ncbi:hypothetical protein Slin15195_G051610 [Septoria linicola]|uniref:Uncharacterized protein n=1 Tax=Septoria linicola TaxID=215465 RepID=A0A9Q9EJ69_9PEZI|nr:hypothetical protein Slin15195_G051610 [Septoria linicola]
MKPSNTPFSLCALLLATLQAAFVSADCKQNPAVDNSCYRCCLNAHPCYTDGDSTYCGSPTYELV